MKKIIYAFSLLFFVIGSNAQTFTNYTTANGLVGNEISGLVIDSKGNKWFSTSWSGVSKFKGTTWTSYKTANGLAKNNILCVAVDAQDCLWFGTNTAGVSKFDTISWTTYNSTNTSDGLSYDVITSIGIDGNIRWFGTYDHGVSKFSGGTWTTYTEATGLANDVVNAITIDGSGNKWFGTPGGVSKLTGSSWTTYTTANGLVNNDVRSIAIDLQGSLWFGTMGGVSKFDGVSTWTNYTAKINQLTDNYVYDIEIDGSGNKWFATGYGVSKLSGTSWTTYTTENGLINNQVSEVEVDPADRSIWFGTYGGASKLVEGVSAIEETALNNLMDIYPNPTTGIITIELSQTANESVLAIININGQELLKQQIKANKTQIDISNLKSGVYFAKIINENTGEVRKIVKE